MFSGIELGLSGEKEIEVIKSLTIATLSDEFPAVYGTPAMILLMELAAADVIAPLLPPGYISVGVEVNVRHLAATPMGERVTAQARIVEVNQNLVRFEVEARDSRQLIGTGTHARAIIEVARFLRGLQKQAGASLPDPAPTEISGPVEIGDSG